MKLKVYHGIENYDFKYGVVSMITLIHLYSNKFIQEIISF